MKNTKASKQPAASDLSTSAVSVIRELDYLMRKMANPPRACMCSDHIAGQDANRAEVRKLLRKRIEFHNQRKI